MNGLVQDCSISIANALEILQSCTNILLYLQTLIVEAFDDADPELQETFDIVLESAISEDNLVGTTDTSGPSINPNYNSANITILETDQPYGLLQFGTGNPPSFNDPFVPPATEPPMVCINFFHCPACRTTLVATRFRVAVICPIIQVPHCIRVFFYFV